MASEEFCELCLLPVSMCGHRKPHPASSGIAQHHPGTSEYDWAHLWAIAHPDDGLRDWIISQYGGRCRGCGSVFEAGELIRYYADEDGYLAECCGGSSP